MSELSIKILKKNEFSQLNRFLAKCPHSTMYHSQHFWAFLETATNAEVSCIAAIQNSIILGILPLVSYEEKLGTVINSLSWFGSHGGCLLVNSNQSDVRQALIKSYSDIVNKPEVSASTLIMPTAEEQHIKDYILHLSEGVVQQRRTQVSQLPLYNETLEKNLLDSYSQKTRNLVRKSLKQNFSLIHSDELIFWKYLHEEHLRGCQANGAPAKPWNHFMAIRNKIPSQLRSLFVAQRDNRPVAALLLLHNNKQVEYLIPTISAEYRSSQPLSFLIFNAMVKLIKDGYTQWNWGGTSDSLKSLHHFKAGWGAKDITYHMITKIKPELLAELKRDRLSVSQRYPFFYIYPYQYLKQ